MFRCRVRSDANERVRISGDDSGDMCSVAVVVERIGIVIDEVVAAGNFVPGTESAAERQSSDSKCSEDMQALSEARVKMANETTENDLRVNQRRQCDCQAARRSHLSLPANPPRPAAELRAPTTAGAG